MSRTNIVWEASKKAGRHQLDRQLRDNREEYWRAHKILDQLVNQAGHTGLGRKTAERAIVCLRRIRTDRFGRQGEINAADLRLSRWLEQDLIKNVST